MTLYNQDQFEQFLPIDGQHNVRPAASQWILAGTAAEGLVRYTTTVDVTGSIPTEHQKAAAYRILCLFIIGCLDDKAIIEAYNNLQDIYSWQMDQFQHPPKLKQVISTPLKSITRVSRTPFIVDMGA
jgi:hypothetical protein